MVKAKKSKEIKKSKEKKYSFPKKPFEPEFAELSSQKMAVVYSKGDPNEVLEKLMAPLYGTVMGYKFSFPKSVRVKMPTSRLHGRWPDAHLVPKNQWTGILGIPIPNDTMELPKEKDPDNLVKIEVWNYGIIAQITHIGPYSEEGPTVKKLHDFIFDNGYVFNGTHEEIYVSRPGAKNQKTIIVHPIKKASKEEVEKVRKEAQMIQFK